MSRPLAMLAVLMATSTAAGVVEARGQVVRGQVLDAVSDAPISGVHVTLVDVDGMAVVAGESDEVGRFELRAPSGGSYVVSAVRLGYLSFRSDRVSVPAGRAREVRLRLGVEAIPLAPFVVVADSELSRGRAADFERRRDDPSLGGQFLDLEDIRRRPMATPTALLAQLPAVILYQVQTVDNNFGLDRSLIYLPGARGGSIRPGSCLAQVFVNGIPVRQTEDGRVSVDDVLQGVPIVGVELYSRAAAAPIEYRGTGECGVVLYWTEEPSASSGSWSFRRIAVGFGAIVGVLLLGFLG